MDSPTAIAEAIRVALEKRRFKRAMSILEQGILTLARSHPKPACLYDDDTPVSELGLEYRTVQALDRHGIITLGKLRRAVAEGQLPMVSDIGAKTIDKIEQKLLTYHPRRNHYRGKRR